MDEKEITDALRRRSKYSRTSLYEEENQPTYVMPSQLALNSRPLLSNLISQSLSPEAYSSYEIMDEIAEAHARHSSKQRNNFTKGDTDMIMERYNLRMKDKLRRHVQELLNRTRVYEKAAKNEISELPR